MAKFRSEHWNEAKSARTRRKFDLNFCQASLLNCSLRLSHRLFSRPSHSPLFLSLSKDDGKFMRLAGPVSEMAPRFKAPNKGWAKGGQGHLVTHSTGHMIEFWPPLLLPPSLSLPWFLHSILLQIVCNSVWTFVLGPRIFVFRPCKTCRNRTAVKKCCCTAAYRRAKRYAYTEKRGKRKSVCPSRIRNVLRSSHNNEGCSKTSNLSTFLY